jgi:hypothetical protein
MRVRRTLAALLAAPALLLAACGGGSSTADPPVSSGPTSSPPTTSPPAHETAEHFIRRWADAEKRMENTGKTRMYASLTRHCEACDSLIHDVRRFYSNGGYVRWEGLRVLSAIKTARQTDGTFVYKVRTDSTPTHYRESASGAVETIKGGLTTELVTLRRLDFSWRVTARARAAQ